MQANYFDFLQQIPEGWCFKSKLNMPKANDFLAQKIEDHFKIDLQKYEEKQEDMAKDYKIELESKEARILELEDENERLKLENKKEIEKKVQESRRNINALYEGKHESLKKLFNSKIVSYQK